MQHLFNAILIQSSRQSVTFSCRVFLQIQALADFQVNSLNHQISFILVCLLLNGISDKQ